MHLDLPEPAAAAPSKDAPTRIEAISPGCAMARPKESDEAIVREAAESIAEDCARWAEDQPSEWVDFLMKIGRHQWQDGYKLARALEREALIDPDSELVEILDGASSKLRGAHERAVRKWVRIVGFDPAHAVGDAVTCRQGQGVVNRIIVETAQYVVDTDGRGNGGYVIEAEDVKAAAPAA